MTNSKDERWKNQILENKAKQAELRIKAQLPKE